MYRFVYLFHRTQFPDTMTKCVCFVLQFLLECLQSVAHDAAAADVDDLLSENAALQLLLAFRNLLVVLAASKVRVAMT